MGDSNNSNRPKINMPRFNLTWLYIIIATKNQENKIEGFLRSFLFRVIYGKEENVKDVIVTDLGSKDETPKIIESLSKDYECIKIATWRECKNIIDSINET